MRGTARVTLLNNPKKLSPSFANEPFLPPALIVSNCLLLLEGKLRTAFRNRMHRSEADLRTEFVHPLGILESPRSNSTISRIIQPLCSVTLWPVLMHGN